MATKAGRAKGFLEGLTAMFKHGDAPSEEPDASPDAGFAGAAASLDVMLQRLSERAEAQREAERRQQAVVSGSVVGMAEEDQKAVKEQRLRDVHARIRQAVLEMHARLGTGIDADTLTHLDGFMHEIREMIDTSPSAGVEPYVRAAVAKRFFRESGPLAWARLRASMDAASIEWPAPDAHLREHNLAEAAEMFANSTPGAMTDLVTGVVKVWQDHYPATDSQLWEAVALRAVAAGLRARMLERGIEHVRANADELRAKGEALIRDEIETVQKALAAGVRSVEEADRIMAGAGGVLAGVLPDICWDYARPVFEAAD